MAGLRLDFKKSRIGIEWFTINIPTNNTQLEGTQVNQGSDFNSLTGSGHDYIGLHAQRNRWENGKLQSLLGFKTGTKGQDFTGLQLKYASLPRPWLKVGSNAHATKSFTNEVQIYTANLSFFHKFIGGVILENNGQRVFICLDPSRGDKKKAHHNDKESTTQ